MSSADAFALWLADCRGRGWAHGQALAFLLPPMDRVRNADVMLVAAELEGVIVRGIYEPTIEQMFFGVGGRAGLWVGGPAHGKVWKSKGSDISTDTRCAVEFVWMPGGST